MTISDETLMAYLDNELPPEERARVNEALAADPQLQARLKRQERVHAMLRASFDPALVQPVPERLVASAMTTPVVAPLRWRTVLSGLFSGQGFVPRLAMAGVLLATGLALGVSLAPQRAGFGGAPLMVQGALQTALDTQLAADASQSGPRIGVSFRAQDGRVCRTFDMRAAADNFAGIACRDGSAWVLVALAAAEAPAGTAYELASAGLPTAVREAVNGMISGEPFDAAAEERAREGGWR